MRPLVFAGPSLHGLDLPAGADIDLAAPAGAGDLLRATLSGRRVIGLIDGTFETGPAVWHKEILYALSQGCAVFGAASMGALRAAECAAFGMTGVGAIFEDYRSGRRTSDADVALIFGPRELGYPPLSLPLVDAEDGLSRLLADGLLDQREHDKIVLTARTLFFKDRTWDRLFEVVGETVSTEQCRRWLATSGPGLKARDALELLIALGNGAPTRRIHHFQPTMFFERLQQSLGGE